MDFSFTAEQQRYADQIREFAEERVAPFYQEGDVTGEMRPGLPAELAGQGLMGLRVPVEQGGLGAGCVTTGLALEELARADFNACYGVLQAALIADVIVHNATSEQRARWLPAIASGRALVALCLTEPEHGSDAAAIGLRAEPDGSGGWRLHGVKTSIMLGAYATHGLVFARTGGPGARGVTAFYLGLDDARVTRARTRDLGGRAAGRAELEFDGLPASPGEVVGGEGLGFVQVMRGFDYSRALISLMCLAAAGVSLDEANEHVRTRQAFGGPLGRFQGVAFPLAEHAGYLRAARLLAYEALWLKDQGRDPAVPANMAKAWAPRAAVEACHQALLTFGQLGWSESLPLAQRLRDVIGLEIGDGTAQVTRLVVARRLLGREHAP
ncbi:acyl-CoA dehydrogenase family protein [Spirillospora sp. CA-294931]|uniref:acyl-CoA dehydrogenase family protein n=1 Tax=Spirillospora sp. CA-294931 TaxID=3240042 RepID=UPI003D8ADE3B